MNRFYQRLPRALCVLLAAALALSACSRKDPQPEPAPPPDLDSSFAQEPDPPPSESEPSSEPEPSSDTSGEPDTPPSEASSGGGDSLPEFNPPQITTSTESASRGSIQLEELPESPAPDLPRAGGALLSGKGVSLIDWQWVDNFRMLILARYPEGETPAVRLVLYDSRDGTILEQYASDTADDTAYSFFNDDNALFFVNGQILAYKKPDGVKLNTGEMPDFSGYLPPQDEEYRYYGLQFSSDRKFFLYERSPHGYELQGRPASDRIIIDTERQDAGSHPLRDISFTFDVRTTPKTVRWIHGSDRILVDAQIARKDEYGVYDRKAFVYDAGSGKLIEEFTPPGGGELVLCDAYKTRVLYEKPGENYELIVYDYKTGKSATAARLDGQTRGSCAARFSLNGTEVALVRPDTELTPEIYPAPEG